MAFDRRRAARDNILCDSPPLENLAEAMIVASHHHRAVILVLHQHRVPFKSLRIVLAEYGFEPVEALAYASFLIGQSEIERPVQFLSILEELFGLAREQLIVPLQRRADRNVGVEDF